ncbi:gephyrin-like molybdotransferase Glp [Telmatospirillum sp.]|uniref:molybdopterin molybdotransferase MoeA n=1 Tax=Telmatospirillum sp. TaxID=2079197 RepID=UPI00283CC1EF|nr:gephyrin-like molybdotransferase Glp [Telmatospirillum sp.]MDR3437061.1 molybdopterin molybdotransferase MoeA [Telmatospirillum sp.]
MSLQDCFRAPEALIPLDQAMVFLTERLEPVVPIEQVPAADAGHRVLAEDVVSPVTNPPFACSAMDGFAFAFDDLPSPGQPAALRVTGRIAAGHVHHGPFGRGEAARIFTGAPVPPAFDTVVMQEDCRVEGEMLELPEGVVRGSWVRPAGLDISAGAVVLHQGRRLRPQDIAMAASVGRTTLSVYRRLKVGVFSTGDELVDPGNPLPEGAVYGCNRQGIVAMVRGLGCDAEDLGNIPDRLDLTRQRLASASERYDLLITSGGVSMGEEDHVKAAVDSLGAIHLWRLAIKPGKPTALGHVGKAAFVGLPGNPVASQVTFMMVARPVILRLAGAVAEPVHPWRFPIKAAFSFDKNEPRRQFIRVSLQRRADGQPEAHLFRSQESNVLSSLVETDGLVDLREDLRHVAPGDMVDFIPYSDLQW